MSERKAGDLCPHCGKGKLTVHPDREVKEESTGSASHRSWLCDNPECGKITRDFARGIVEPSVNVSDSVKVEKKSWFSKFRKK